MFKGISSGELVSFAGRSQINLEGYGMSHMPTMNTMLFSAEELTQSNYNYTGPPLTTEDAFNSSPIDGMLSYTMPAATTLWPGSNIDDFKPYDSVTLSAKVRNEETGDIFGCSDSACNLKYSWDYTPIWYYNSPPVTYYGQEINVYYNPLHTPLNKLKGEPPVEFMLDGQRLNTTDVISSDTNLSRNRWQNTRGTVLTEERNQDVDFSVELSGAGKALKFPSADTCLLDGTCYGLKNLPSVSAVSSSEGYTTGFKELTITGTSLDGSNVTVEIDGNACDVTSVTESQVKCTPGFSEASSNQAQYVGQHGLRKLHGRSGTSSLMTQFEVAHSPYLNPSTDTITGYFEAPVDGRYKFHMTCNRNCELYLSGVQVGELIDPDAIVEEELMAEEESASAETETAEGSEAPETNTDTNNLSVESNDASDNSGYSIGSSVDQTVVAEENLGNQTDIIDTGSGRRRLQTDTDLADDLASDADTVEEPEPCIDTMDPACKVLHISQGATSFRDALWYDNNDHIVRGDPNQNIGKLYSTWLTLQAGQKYYIEASHYVHGSNMHLSVGVEIEPADGPIESHPNIKPQEQSLVLTHKITRDTAEIKITGADGGLFVLFFMKQDMSFWVSNPIEAGCKPGKFKDAIKDFYNDELGIEPVVNRKCIDFYDRETDCETEEPELIRDHIYLIKILKSIWVPSTTTLNAIPISTSSILLTTSPMDFKLSNPPLTGRFYAECYDLGDDTPKFTYSLARSASNTDLYRALYKACPTLRDRISVEHGNEYEYSEDGIDFIIKFTRVQGQLPQFKLHPDLNNPLKSGNDGNPEDLFVIHNELRPYGPNLYYPVIPFDWLYTNEASPQILVTVDDMPALCVSLQCDYTIYEPQGTLNSFSVNGTDVTIQGTDLPLDLEKVLFSDIECIVSSNDETNISCTLEKAWVAGYYVPEVHDARGLLPVSQTMNVHQVPLVMESVTPNTELNKAGGDILTIKGANFPHSLDNFYNISFFFTEGNRCIPIETSSTQILCKTEIFRDLVLENNFDRRMLFQSVLWGTAGGFLVNSATFNPLDGWQSFEESLPDDGSVISEVINVGDIDFGDYDGEGEDVDLKEQFQQIIKVTPEVVSPILMEEVTLTFNPEYPQSDMQFDTFTVSIIPLDDDNERPNGSTQRQLAVISINPDDKGTPPEPSITVKYTGAYVGLYDFEVVSALHGNIAGIKTPLIVKIAITNFYPTSGSRYGGTLVTIEGGVFSDLITDNPVKIGYEYLSGVDHYCYVQESQKGTDPDTYQDGVIKCRIATDYERQAGEEDVIVFASAFDESVCEFGDCKFTFLDSDSLPTVNDVTKVYDETLDAYVITVTGTGFTDTKDEIDVFIGDRQQEVLSASDSTIQIKITGIDSGKEPGEFKLYTLLGVPNGMQDLELDLSLEPRLVSLNTNAGSVAGSTIYATVAGIGPNDFFLGTSNGSTFTQMTQYTLVTATSYLCSTSSIVAPNTIECKTKPNVVISPNTPIGIRNIETGVMSGCAPDPDKQAKCLYETFSSTETIQTVSIDDSSTTQMVFTGTKYQSSGCQFCNECKVAYNGVIADECEIQSDTTVIATFNSGIPIAPLDYVGAPTGNQHKPQLVLIDTTGDNIVEHNVLSDVSLVRNLVMTGNSGRISCGYAGGCPYEIEAVGLTTSIREGLAQVSVCGKTCELDEAQSTDLKAVCSLDYIQTSRSAQVFEQENDSRISTAGLVGSSMAMVAAIDNDLTVGIENSGANCFVGLQFRGDHKAIMTDVRIFMTEFPDKDKYVGKLKFQGTNRSVYDPTNNEFDDLFVVGEELHEGWNYYKLSDFDGQSGIDVQDRYQWFRLYSAETNGCDYIGQVDMLGIQLLDQTQDDYTCHVKIEKPNGFMPTFTVYDTIEDGVTLKMGLSAYLEDISPRFGSVEGGTVVTFTGNNFSDTISDYTVLIDQVQCDVIEASATSFKCITGPRIGLYEEQPSLKIYIEGKGEVALQFNTFTYVSLWSDISTWGNTFTPVEGESIHIPKGMNLLVDIDVSPKLNLVIVEGGQLIFAPDDDNPDHERKFDANYIFIHDGWMQVGTEARPYTSKLVITLHGQKYDPSMPLYGNKCIGVRDGILDMHGAPRSHSWTSLEETALAGQNTIKVQGLVDWVVGEKIIIASTDFDQDQAEELTIIAVAQTADPTGSGLDTTTFTLNANLQFEHIVSIQTYGTETVELRGEVGLLSRNVVFRGDEGSAETQYGATILLASDTLYPSIGRIENIEMYDVGQVGQIARYPIHFHLMGDVHLSYVQQNSIHQSYNRGTTIHGVRYLRVLKNVYYNIIGHTVFIQDGIEAKNRIEDNLVVRTLPSWSLLNTDMTPSAYWITNPDNIIRGNHAAGAAFYGFWYDLPEHPTGSSKTTSICPINERMGEFSNNVAHSTGHYGLRVFHGHEPRVYPCEPISVDNPVLPAYYENFLGYKNGRNAVIGGEMGAVIWRNIQAVDSGVAGIEIEQDVNAEPNMGYIDGALVVGKSGAGNSGWDGDETPHGVITPRTDRFWVKNVKFYNFQEDGFAAIGSCSHCFSPYSTDTGARTVNFEGIFYDPTTVNRRIRYQFPYKAIFYDTDGTLTDQSPGGWATPDWAHNRVWDECSVIDIYGGLVCTPAVTVRRVHIAGYSPGSLYNQPLYVLPYDQSIIGNMDSAELTSYSNYVDSSSPISKIGFREKSWTMPMVTGHRYQLRWGDGLDFTNFVISITDWLWDEYRDPDMELEIPFWAYREAVVVTLNTGEVIANDTFVNYQQYELMSSDERGFPGNRMGSNKVSNATYDQLTEWGRIDEDTPLVGETVKNIKLTIGQNNVPADDGVSSLTLEGIACIGGCPMERIEIMDGEYILKWWSRKEDWTNLPDRIPIEGDKVVIEANWHMMYDIGTSPDLFSIEIRGKLTFYDAEDAVRDLRSHSVWIRSGYLTIGTQETPYTSEACITLLGDNTEKFWSFRSDISSSNKNLVVTGYASLYGLARNDKTRLLTTAMPNQKILRVPTNLDWLAGEKLAVAPTNMKTTDFDICEIESYNMGNGEVTCVEDLIGFHYGASSSTEAQWGVDMRAEVVLLNRNIKIRASTEDKNPIGDQVHGCRIQISDFYDLSSDARLRSGSLFMDNVSVEGCSQEDTYKAAIQFEYATQGNSVISNSVIHQGRSWGLRIITSANIDLINNSFVDFVQHGLRVENGRDVLIENNWVIYVRPNADVTNPALFAADKHDPEGFSGFTVSNELNQDIIIRNNIAAGTWNVGFKFRPEECDQTSSYVFTNNIAHSISGIGLEAVGRPVACNVVKNMIAYKCTDAAISLSSDAEINRGDSLTSIHSGKGLQINAGIGGNAELINSVIYGELEDNYECEGEAQNCASCIDTFGIILSVQGDFQKKNAGEFTGGSDYYRNELINFASTTTACGSRQAAIAAPSDASNYIPFALFRETTFTNSDTDALFYIPSPDVENINPDLCGNFVCTGLYNVVMRFEQTFGLPVSYDSDFTVVSQNNQEEDADSSLAIPSCEAKKAWNAVLCPNSRDIGVLTFESLDEDRLDRAVQPVWVSANTDATQCPDEEEEPCFNNKLNAFKDGCQDGFYKCQKRESKFPTMVYQQVDQKIAFTGTPPEKLRFRLHARSGTPGFLVTIDYPNAGAYQLYNEDNNPIQPTDWDNTQKNWAEVSKTSCGEWRFLGVENRLQFFIDPGCELTVYPRDAIMLGIRMEFTLAEFWETGGVVTFVDRMAAVLGIHRADIKIVQVYEGSTVIEFMIISNPEDEEPLSLTTVKDNFVSAVSTMATFMGSPLLNAVSQGVQVVTPNTPEGEDQAGGFNFSDIAENFTFNDDEPEQEVKTQFNFKVQTKGRQGASNTTKYIIILCAVIVALLVLSFGLGLYNRFALTKRQEAKKQYEIKQNTQGNPEEMIGPDGFPFQSQYVPKADENDFDLFDDSKKRKQKIGAGKIQDSVSKLVHTEEEQKSEDGRSSLNFALVKSRTKAGEICETNDSMAGDRSTDNLHSQSTLSAFSEVKFKNLGTSKLNTGKTKTKVKIQNRPMLVQENPIKIPTYHAKTALASEVSSPAPNKIETPSTAPGDKKVLKKVRVEENDRQFEDF